MTPPTTRQLFCVPAFLLLATLVAYLPALRADYVWDDPQHVTANPTLRSLDGLRQIWLRPEALPQYYPLVHSTFWIERRLWGDRPAGYHLVNVLLHALSAVLVFRLLRRLAVPGALLAAALFALHPVHAESVAWITERKNVLSGAFFLGSLLAYVRHLGLGDDKPGSRRDYWLALGLFLAALLSKTVTASLPAVVLVLCYWKGRRLTRGEAFGLGPFFVLGAALGLHTAWLEKHQVGAAGAEWSLSAAERVLVAGRALWFYLGKLAWPSGLSFIYPRWTLGAATAWLYPLAVVIALVGLFALRGRIGRGPLAAALCYGLSLGPALGFFDVYPMRFSFVADHFQYLASLGPIALGSALAARLGRPALAAPLLLALGALTFARASVFHDQETLWRDALRKNPGCWLCQNNLGAYLLTRGRDREAVEALTAAVSLKPAYVEARINLGFALSRVGETDTALEHYEQALRIDPRNAAANQNLGRLLAGRGRLEEAIAHFERAARASPPHALVQQDLGRALALQGRLAEAVEPLRRGLVATPNDAEAHRELGHVLTELGRLDEAVAQQEEALRLDPASTGARYGLARALAARGETEKAVRELTQLLRLQPGFSEARSLLERLSAGQPAGTRPPPPPRSKGR